MKDLIIVGAGGFGREVAWLVERINRSAETWRLMGFLEDAKAKGTLIYQYPVLGAIGDAGQFKDAKFVCAIGAAEVRRRIIQRMQSMNPDITFATLIDPTAELSSAVTVGEGTIICAHTIVTVDVQIGKHVIINLDCTVGHDSVIEDYATIYPSVNISGMTRIGNTSELGTGTQIIQGKTIAEHTIVGAGAVVVRDIENSCTAVGIPAKKIKDR